MSSRLRLGIAGLGFLLLASVVGPQFAGDPIRPDPQARVGTPGPPGARHPLGTDSRGRDVLSRLVSGARLSLTIGIGATLFAILTALTLGILAGYCGGRVDRGVMGLTEVFLAFPAVLLALVLAAVAPRRDVAALVLIIGGISWAQPARLFRAESMVLRSSLFVEAARAAGAGHARILVRHILPQLGPTALVAAGMAAASTILMDAGLSFLHVGLPPPAPSWGSMLQDAQQYYAVAPWLALWPGLAVVGTVGTLNLITFELQETRRSAA